MLLGSRLVLAPLASVSPSVQWPRVRRGDSHCPGAPAHPRHPHTTHRQLCPPQAKYNPRPLPLPTVLTGTRCSNLVVLGWGWQDPAGWQASPGFGPGTYNQLLPL